MLEIEKFNKIIAANWKMNGSLLFIDNFVEILSLYPIKDSTLCSIICPPINYLNYLENKLPYHHLGSQDCSIYLEGAFTGEIGATMLKDMGCKFCIVGHSERRTRFHEKIKKFV